LSGFLDSNKKINPLNTGNIHVVLTGKHTYRLQQQQSTISEIAQQVRPSIWNMSLNSKGVLEHVADLHTFSVFVAHCCVKAAVILGH
jgi:hypothetical protein